MGAASKTARLMSDKRQKNQLELAFTDGGGVKPQGPREGTEPLAAKRGTESPARRTADGGGLRAENCKQALKRVKANKGARESTG